jgi:hypothetical protein
MHAVATNSGTGITGGTIVVVLLAQDMTVLVPAGMIHLSLTPPAQQRRNRQRKCYYALFYFYALERQRVLASDSMRYSGRRTHAFFCQNSLPFPAG